MFDCGSELPGHEFKNTLTEEENGILSKPVTSGKTQANSIIKRIHQVLGKFIQNFELDNNYVYEDESWKVILVASSFANHYMFHKTIKDHLTN